MFSNLKRMIEKNHLASVIFILDEGDITLRKTWSDYKVVFECNEGFAEYETSEAKFLKYLENAMQKFAFSGDFKIINTVKTESVCSFMIKRI